MGEQNKMTTDDWLRWLKKIGQIKENFFYVLVLFGSTNTAKLLSPSDLFA